MIGESRAAGRKHAGLQLANGTAITADKARLNAGYRRAQGDETTGAYWDAYAERVDRHNEIAERLRIGYRDGDNFAHYYSGPDDAVYQVALCGKRLTDFGILVAYQCPRCVKLRAMAEDAVPVTRKAS